jgi:hypothetical protein
MTTPTESTKTDVSTDKSYDTDGSRKISKISNWLIGLTLVLLVLGLVISLTAAETWAPVIQIFRDIFIVIMVIEIILIIGATSILLVQLTRFVIMLQTEVKPIIDNARETTQTTRVTAEFVKTNAVDPFLQLKTFLAGLTTFIRELLKIRALLNPDENAEDNTNA